MTYLKIHHMPGPTPEAQAAQLDQFELLEAVYSAYNKTRSMDSPECKAARAKYDESVQALETMLGKEVPGQFVDCELAQSFSDHYKFVLGLRPRGLGYTRQQMLDWQERNNQQVTED